MDFIFAWVFVIALYDLGRFRNPASTNAAADSFDFCAGRGKVFPERDEINSPSNASKYALVQRKQIFREPIGMKSVYYLRRNKSHSILN
ncbi:MAG TPA: hypothetical protein DDW52_20250 [Planctomycetaceae bacterium]|nr:hypothetical protein [Planctomycetaceae bacterium]